MGLGFRFVTYLDRQDQFDVQECWPGKGGEKAGRSRGKGGEKGTWVQVRT